MAISIKLGEDYPGVFGLDCIRRFVSNFLEIEADYNFRHNKIVITQEDKLYHESNNTCHKVRNEDNFEDRDHSRETF